MEGVAAAAQAREGAFKNEGARRRNWLTRRWRTSAAGNDFIKTDGFHVTVYRRGSGWGARVTHTASGHSVPSRSAYTTSDAVKLAAFDKMLALKAEQPWLDTRPPRTAGRPDGLRGRPT